MLRSLYSLTIRSVCQAEFCGNVFSHRTQVLNRMYGQYRRDHLRLGRLDTVKVMFDRRITGKTPSRFQTRVLRQGVVGCLKVFYKKNFLNQHRILRSIRPRKTLLSGPRWC